MKKIFTTILLLGLTASSFTAHGMFRSLFNRTQRPLTSQIRPLNSHIQRVTPDEYYDYDYHHDDYRMNKWQKQKSSIQEAIEKAENNAELIKEIVNQTEYTTTGYTPICHAAEMNDIEFAQFLINHGAEINQEILGFHSSKPIFYAKTLEMTKLLQDNGADMHCYNEGQGVTSGMNLLHTGIHCNTQDDRLFDYMLTQNLNPDSLNLYNGGNLWHSLVYCSVRYCPEKRLFSRVKKLHDLTINPYHKNRRDESAISIVEREIREMKPLNTKKYLPLNFESSSTNDNTPMLEKLERLHDSMKTNKTPNFIEKE